MKTKLSILLSLSVMILVAGCTNQGGSNQEGEATDPAELTEEEQKQLEAQAMEQMKQLSEEPVFDIVTNFGTIRVKLYADTPKHRDNFAKLALSGYYDGLLFHRVIKDFMIQGGDPLTKRPDNKDKFGTGGPGYQIEAEIVPEHHHKKGALAAARKGNIANPLKESSGSQFYIVQSEEGCRHLDGEYTIFGETIDGFNVIDAIGNVATDERNVPISSIRIKSIKLVTNP